MMDQWINLQYKPNMYACPAKLEIMASSEARLRRFEPVYTEKLNASITIPPEDVSSVQ
jgi:hypothetical protein